MTPLPKEHLMTPVTSYRLGLTVALLTLLLLVYGIGALGVVGSGGPADLMYVAAAAVGIVGAAIARLRAPGMARALTAAALATLLAGAVAIVAGLAEDASVLDVVGLSGMYACLYGLSARLFHRAAAQQQDAVSGGRA
jgi:hypothetical protein